MKYIQIIAAISGFFWVAISAAFGHDVLAGKSLEYFQKAQLYQIIHTVLIIALANRSLRFSYLISGSWLLGITLFSGGLYLMATLQINVGYFIPAGGILFLVGWFLLIVSCFSERKCKKGNI